MDEQDVLIQFLTGKMESKDFIAAVQRCAAGADRDVGSAGSSS